MLRWIGFLWNLKNRCFAGPFPRLINLWPFCSTFASTLPQFLADVVHRLRAPFDDYEERGRSCHELIRNILIVFSLSWATMLCSVSRREHQIYTYIIKLILRLMTTMMTMSRMMMTLPSLWSNERRVQLIRTVRQEPSNKPPSAVSSLPLLIFSTCTSFSKRSRLIRSWRPQTEMRNCGEGELVIKWPPKCAHVVLKLDWETRLNILLTQRKALS